MNISKVNLLKFFIVIALLGGCDGNDDSDITEIASEEEIDDSEEETDDSSQAEATVDCIQLETFTDYSDLVETSCDDEFVHVHSETGLPHIHDVETDDQVMIGIQAWINRVPIPYDYEWKIPRYPIFLHDYEEASPKGPIAMAVNGVPIFHLEPRPDVSTDPANYSPNFDTVLAGELDQCGGHAGQGEDYHYHYAPVCLLDSHDLEKPIAYGLDGIPIYFGTGGTDYYGQGRYNDINNLPAQELDECNAILTEDDEYEYYTTSDAPYTIGCHRGTVDLSLQIEPSPLSGREQGNPVPSGIGFVGEPLETDITNFYLDDDGRYHLEYLVNGTASATIYQYVEDSDDCWEFEFRADVEQAGVTEIYCR